MSQGKPTLFIDLPDAPPVSEQPYVRLSRWAIHKVDDALYLIGWNIERDSPRLTSHIVQFDRQTRTVITSSGRCYQLVGNPGADPMTQLAWEVQCRLCSLATSSDVTQELLGKPEAP
jgi:hypothetical protein